MNGGRVRALQAGEPYPNAAGHSVLNLNGGVLEAAADQIRFVTADEVYVRPGGAFIDTAGHDVQIDRPLLDDGNAGGGLTKLGDGTLLLTASALYDGDTVVSNGTLRLYIGGLLPNTTNIVVHEGATLHLPENGDRIASHQTLRGRGSISGPISFEPGSTLAPGESPGTLTVSSDLTLAAGVNLVAELESSNAYDRIEMAGFNDTFTIAGASLEVIDSSPFVYGTVFTLVNGYAVRSGEFYGLSDGSTFATGNNQYQIAYDVDGSRITVTAIPEPGTGGLVALCAALGALRRRWRSRR